MRAGRRRRSFRIQWRERGERYWRELGNAKTDRADTFPTRELAEVKCRRMIVRGYVHVRVVAPSGKIVAKSITKTVVKTIRYQVRLLKAVR